MQNLVRCFVQISDENLHHVRDIMDETLRPQELCCLVAFQKTTSASGEPILSVYDYLFWYGENIVKLK